MKRTQLIEAGILIVGLIFGYKFFESIISLVIQLVFSFSYMLEMSAFFPALVYIVFYAGCFVLLIRQSNYIAKYLGANADDTVIPIKINKRALLHVTLIVLAIITILSSLPEIIIYLFESFRNEVNSKSFYDDARTIISKEKFTYSAVGTIIAFLLIYFSKTISSWFFQKDPAEELTFDSTSENKTENV